MILMSEVYNAWTFAPVPYWMLNTSSLAPSAGMRPSWCGQVGWFWPEARSMVHSSSTPHLRTDVYQQTPSQGKEMRSSQADRVGDVV
jgi:hypothetical protein